MCVQFHSTCTPLTFTNPTFQISWGTKQDDIVEADLGVVIQDSHSQVDVEMFADAADANELYEDSLSNLKTRKPLEQKKTRTTVAEREQHAKEYYASVRTNVRSCRLTVVISSLVLMVDKILMAWVVSNVRSEIGLYEFVVAYDFPCRRSWLLSF